MAFRSLTESPIGQVKTRELMRLDSDLDMQIYTVTA